MALFKTKKEIQNLSSPPSPKASEDKRPVSGSVRSSGDLSHILRHARITEKASMHMEQSVYVFDVAPRATKTEIAAAVQKLYSVAPRMVRIAIVQSKTKRSARTGKTGISKGGKKAYVYLKKGETINL
jgi:large subunit ribosomal protein L23